MQLYQVTSLNTSPTWYSNVSFFECRYINLVAEHILTTAPAICREFVTSGPSFFTGSRTIYRPDSSLRVVLRASRANSRPQTKSTPMTSTEQVVNQVVPL
ncbi:uncharacterized protein LOC114354712 isoform X2 [Ostrinia furnacalis]|uniref:uncharacterized protein LOC114354712 isoform X2 n=1 Tax=Ostrinia furnacalis TaxID=93504 RepID=UPI00103EE55C|nr:uncharacterized protein LOC114354712 isoform X2 [Ostrinia furnacalis]